MTKYEITVTLFTIVYGLMLTDLFASLHKLIRVRKTVSWHWLPLSASWFLFLLIIKNWWGLTTPQDNIKYNIIFFFAYSHLLILLYLLVSVSLPDEIQKKGINLKEYYFQIHRYFWGLMTAVILISALMQVIPKLIQSSPLNMFNIIANIVFIVLTILLAISKNYWIHSILVVFFVLQTLLEIVNKI